MSTLTAPINLLSNDLVRRLMLYRQPQTTKEELLVDSTRALVKRVKQGGPLYYWSLIHEALQEASWIDPATINLELSDLAAGRLAYFAEQANHLIDMCRKGMFEAGVQLSRLIRDPNNELTHEMLGLTRFQVDNWYIQAKGHLPMGMSEDCSGGQHTSCDHPECTCPHHQEANYWEDEL